MTTKKVNQKPLNKKMALAELAKLSNNELNSLLRFKEKFTQQEEGFDFIENLTEMHRNLLNAVSWFEDEKELREARSLFFDMCIQYTQQEENDVDHKVRYQMFGIFEMINI